MNLPAAIENVRLRVADAWRERAVSLKAVSFAFVGLINTVVDFIVFILLYKFVTPTQIFIDLVAGFIATVEPYVAIWITDFLTKNAAIIFANVSAWAVAVTGSFVMNSFITFSAETGGKLRLKAYVGFVGSGVVAVIATTFTVVIAADFMPIWAAKGIAILVSFVVNFSITHFVVFRPKGERADVR
jgi:putative flippase GtrA